MADDIRTFKLVTGEEIIGKLIGSSDTGFAGNNMIKLTKVRTIQMMPTGPNQVGVGLLPYSAADVDGAIKFSRSAIVAEIEHGKDMEDAYLQQTTGIQLAGAGSVPGT